MGKSHLSQPVKKIARPIDTVVKANSTIEEALAAFHRKQIDHKVIYFYVVDDENTLLGIVPTRKLLLCNPKHLIADIMEPSVVRVLADQTLQEAMEIFAEYNLLALPVVDNKGKLIGAIDVGMYMEESFDIADANHRKDVFQVIGLSLEEEKRRSTFGDYRLRMPWIFCNMAGGIACAIISKVHHVVLGKILVLAMFIPLVLTLSESVSMQAMVHSLHFLRHPKEEWRRLFKKVYKECRVVGMMAVTCGVIVGFVSLLWGEGPMPSLTIGLGILISVAVSSSFGIFLPIILHKTRLDPKVASGPVVLMLADVVTTALYLSLASFWLL